jgi:hypothetical protein
MAAHGNSLFLADLLFSGGAVFQITTLAPVPEPRLGVAVLVALVVMAAGKK